MFIDPGQTLLTIACLILGFTALHFKMPRCGIPMVLGGGILALLPPPTANDVLFLGGLAILVMLAGIIFLVSLLFPSQKQRSQDRP